MREYLKMQPEFRLTAPSATAGGGRLRVFSSAEWRRARALRQRQRNIHNMMLLGAEYWRINPALPDDIPHTIQPREQSKGGGTEGIPHVGSVASIDGKQHVAYLNRNDTKRNLNLNWRDNDWNDIYRFAAVRNSHHGFSAGMSFLRRFVY